MDVSYVSQSVSMHMYVYEGKFVALMHMGCLFVQLQQRRPPSKYCCRHLIRSSHIYKTVVVPRPPPPYHHTTTPAGILTHTKKTHIPPPKKQDADFTDAYMGEFDLKALCRNPTLQVRKSTDTKPPHTHTHLLTTPFPQKKQKTHIIGHQSHDGRPD